MRRSLVLSDESARHPFLASLPPHVRRQTATTQAKSRGGVFSLQDLRDFLMAFCTCFVLVSAFIA